MLIFYIPFRSVCLRIQETTHYMVFYVFKAVSGGTKLVLTSGSSKEEFVSYSHVLPFLFKFEPLFASKHHHACKGKHKIFERVLVKMTFSFLHAVVRGEKIRKEYAVLQQRHRAAVVIQRHIKSRVCGKKYKDMHQASIIIQSGKLEFCS